MANARAQPPQYQVGTQETMLILAKRPMFVFATRGSFALEEVEKMRQVEDTGHNAAVQGELAKTSNHGAHYQGPSPSPSP